MGNAEKQELLGKNILQNCRNELYLDFPYLDGAFAGLEYKADSNISTIGTDGEKIYFNPQFLMEKYVEDPAALRRGYLHILLHCLYLHVFLIPQGSEVSAEAVERNEWDRECDRFVENLIEKAVREKKIQSLDRRVSDFSEKDNHFDDHSGGYIGDFHLTAKGTGRSGNIF